MRQSLALLALMALLLAACDGAGEPGAGLGAPADLGAFKAGEAVTFDLNDTVHVCTDQLSYAIVQVTSGKERSVLLQHSCVGIVGRGIDQFCEDGQVKTVDVIYCSDAILCEDLEIQERIVWDQKEYVPITEDCAGQTIQREVKEQVPPGEYQIVVQDWKDDRIQIRIVAEFTIVSE
jgi:hypothetical protein